MFRVVLEIDGQPVGYALYRVFAAYGPEALPIHALEVNEALGTSPTATREIWRYLFGVDLIATVRTHRLCAEHPLTLMLADPRRLRLTVNDGTWVRLVDVKAALAGRRYAAIGSLTFEVVDELCPWNAGVWTLEAERSGGTLKRSKRSPDLRLSAAELSAMYLGAIPCTSLVRAGRIDELSPDAARRADLLFYSAVPPWCLDDF